MPFRRRVTKRDANHQAIVRALVGAGRMVVDLSGVGNGCPDLLVAWGGKCMLMEIKNPDGRDHVEPSQEKFRQRWPGPRIIVVRSPEEALRWTGVHLNRNFSNGVGNHAIHSEAPKGTL